MLLRRRVRVSGTVQGVGFRPFVYRQAVALQLSGFVRNDPAGVLIEVQGPPNQVAELCRRLAEAPPPLARVDGIEQTELRPRRQDSTFVILGSDAGGVPEVAVSVDTAPCDACLTEAASPDDRRFGYPFTNCTDCGPRYTITVSVPYDRPATTMAGFVMCPACRAEYDDPGDRRYHAQPNACPDCGPRLRWCRADGAPSTESLDALGDATDALAAGAIVAVKGLGGYHLAVDATNADAVAELRRRKRRDAKPFAVMVPDVEAAHRLVELDADAEAALTSPRRPIVLAARRVGAVRLAEAVAPGLADLGVMLPYTPLHHLLMSRLARPLVLTSGNLSDEPIAHLDDDAVTRLGPLVDGILAHDRPIHVRCDDSVVRAVGGVQVLRRSRGFAPEPITLPLVAGRQTLAVGGQLKNTVAVAKGSSVVASHHIGDLEHLAAYRAFLQAVDHLCHLCGVVPEVVAHDLHPEYLSTKWAADLDLPLVGIQHHHAHVASCLVDHGRVGPVLGVAFDGAGYGPDGTLWGGEFLVADLARFERVGHLRAVPLLGGSAAMREPWRMAVAWADAAGGTALAGAVGRRFDRPADALLGSPGHPVTTSVGRLFDAAAALVVGRSRNSYEGQAAGELEALAAWVPVGRARRYEVDQAWEQGRLVLDPSPVIGALTAATPGPEAAAAFHESIGQATVEAAATLARMRGLGSVALTGGVFQNARLTRIVSSGLRAAGLEVLVHRSVPPNDGGISIGQAAVTAARAGSPGLDAW